MSAYPRYFRPLFWTSLCVLAISGLLLAPGVFELRLEWDVPWSLPGGSRTIMAALHGLGAMVVLVVVGALLPIHVRGGLKTARNFVSGIALLMLFGTLALTGWVIYYVVNEDLSAFASLLHFAAGVLVLLPFAVHAVRGRQLRREQENRFRNEEGVFRHRQVDRRVA